MRIAFPFLGPEVDDTVALVFTEALMLVYFSSVRSLAPKLRSCAVHRNDLETPYLCMSCFI